MTLFNLVQAFIRTHQRDNSKVLTCQEVKKDPNDINKKIAITHEVPVGEHIAAGDALYFEKGNTTRSVVLVMKPNGQDPVTTEMFYVDHADIYTGQRDIHGVNYQLTLKLFETGLEDYLLQISYHNSNDFGHHHASHDGTIHPLP